MAQEVSEREGCFLYDLEFVGKGRGRTLRVFIDTEDNQVSIEQCANVSRGLSLLLDVDDVVPGEAYELEVSSPGLERTLREAWHFEKALGKKVIVKTSAGIPGTESRKSALRQVKGVLESASEEQVVVVENEKTRWEIPMNIIHKAKIIFEFNTTGSKKAPSKKKVNKR